MQTRRLTKSVEKRVTDDWQRHLQSLAVYRPRHLLRRVGPMLIGVCLDRDSGGENYKPCFHVHFLGRPFPVVSLTLCSQLLAKSGGPDYIEVRFHEVRYEEAIRRLVEQAPLPVEGPITIPQVLHAYSQYAETPIGQRQAADLFGDCILLLAYFGRTDDARRMLNDTLTRVQNEQSFQIFGGRQAFEQLMLDSIEHPAKVHDMVTAQISSLNVGNIPADSFSERA